METLRKAAFQDTLEKDNLRLTHTDWGYLEACYLRKALYGEMPQGRPEKNPGEDRRHRRYRFRRGDLPVSGRNLLGSLRKQIGREL